MNFEEWLTEAPFVGGSTDFGYEKESLNRDRALKLLNQKSTEIFEQSDEYLFARFGSYDDGIISFINLQEKLIYYIVKFKKIKIYDKYSMTQTLVWRSKDIHRTNMADEVFDILFKHTNTICSDFEQTKEGRDFWRKRLAKANSQGYYIALWKEDLEDTIEWYDSEKESFLSWRNRIYPEAWSSSDKSKSMYRFIISKTKF